MPFDGDIAQYIVCTTDRNAASLNGPWHFSVKDCDNGMYVCSAVRMSGLAVVMVALMEYPVCCCDPIHCLFCHKVKGETKQ